MAAPSWQAIFNEMLDSGRRKGAVFDADEVRRAKIRAVEQITGRPLIVYAADLFHPDRVKDNPIVSPQDLSISLDDKDGFIEATRDLQGDNLDVIVQSFGGSAEATESIVALLRHRFKHIRFIIPGIAKSAATMLAMSGNELVLNATSDLGPIDPQLATGGTLAPAQAILEQFEEVKRDILDNPDTVAVWLQYLQQLPIWLLPFCQHQIKLAEELVERWLSLYMFNGEPDATEHAKRVAQQLNDQRKWRSHGRRIGIEWLQGEAGLKVLDLATDPALEYAVIALHYAIKLTFDSIPVVKIIENGRGDAFIRMANPITITANQAPAQAPTVGGPNMRPQRATPTPVPALSRRQRRGKH